MVPAVAPYTSRGPHVKGLCPEGRNGNGHRSVVEVNRVGARMQKYGRRDTVSKFAAKPTKVRSIARVRRSGCLDLYRYE